MSRISKVTNVAHKQTGEIITVSRNNPEYGTVMLQQTVVSMEGGFLNKQNRVAFFRGKVVDLQEMFPTAGVELPGNIIKKESFVPFYEGQQPKINPTTQEVIKKEGKEVYLDFEYTEDTSAPLYQWISNTVEHQVLADQVIDEQS